MVRPSLTDVVAGLLDEASYDGGGPGYLSDDPSVHGAGEW